MRFAALLGEEKSFIADGKDKENRRWVALRLVPEWPRKFSKSEKMGAKFVRTTSTIYKQAERKFLPQPNNTCGSSFLSSRF